MTKEWALASLEAGRWVDEEPYEMVDFSPAVKNLRFWFSPICLPDLPSDDCQENKFENKDFYITGVFFWEQAVKA